MKNCFLLLCICLLLSSQAQQIVLESQVDADNQQIHTTVILKNIPVQGRLRYQQRMPDGELFSGGVFKGLQWDTADNILTLIAVQTIQIDSFAFDFNVNYQNAGSTISWGEAALMYEMSDGSVQKITHDAELLYLQSSKKEQIEDSSFVENSIQDNAALANQDVYYIQVSASKSKQALANVKKTLPLQDGDVLCEVKDNKYYCYRIGPFRTQEEAKVKLKYYKTFVKDAFVVKK